MRILLPAALAAATAAVLPVMPASAAHCRCRPLHRVAYAPVRHHYIRRVAYVRPVVRRVVYRPRIVEVVQPVYRPVYYPPVRRVYVEPIWRPRPIFYGPRFHHRPWSYYRHDGFRGGYGWHDGYRYGGGFHRGYGWR